MKLKHNQRWVSRDTNDCFWVNIHANRIKPKLDAERDFNVRSGGCANVCYRMFLAITGISIAPGECVLVEFSAKVVKKAAKRA